jgi:hypothetical protein
MLAYSRSRLLRISRSVLRRLIARKPQRFRPVPKLPNPRLVLHAAKLGGLSAACLPALPRRTSASRSGKVTLKHKASGGNESPQNANMPDTRQWPDFIGIWLKSRLLFFVWPRVVVRGAVSWPRRGCPSLNGATLPVAALVLGLFPRRAAARRESPARSRE